MAPVNPRAQLASEVESVINAVMPKATVMNLPSPISAEGVSISAFDAEDTRSTRQLIDDLDAGLRAAGWSVEERDKDREAVALYVTRPGVGSGVFGAQTAAISFTGLVDEGETA